MQGLNHGLQVHQVSFVHLNMNQGCNLLLSNWRERERERESVCVCVWRSGNKIQASDFEKLLTSIKFMSRVKCSHTISTKVPPWKLQPFLFMPQNHTRTIKWMTKVVSGNISSDSMTRNAKFQLENYLWIGNWRDVWGFLRIHHKDHKIQWLQGAWNTVKLRNINWWIVSWVQHLHL